MRFWSRPQKSKQNDREPVTFAAAIVRSIFAFSWIGIALLGFLNGLAYQRKVRNHILVASLSDDHGDF
jgi:hypothetical protein